MSKSIAEAWYQFTKSLNMLGSVETVSIPPERYTTDKFIIGMDLEKAGVGVPTAAFSGLSLRAMDGLRFEAKGLTGLTTPTKCWAHLYHDILVTIKLKGVEVYS